MYNNLMTMQELHMRLTILVARQSGYGVRRYAIYPETARCLASWAKRQTFAPNGDLSVYQDFEVYQLRGDWPEEIAWLIERTEAVVHKFAAANCDTPLTAWRVNDVAVQRYISERAGIDWHRDFASDRSLVVVFTVEGEAYLDVREASGQEVRRVVQPGSALVLRGIDPGSTEDPRLHHRVGPPLPVPPDGDRVPCISIALRMNSSV